MGKIDEVYLQELRAMSEAGGGVIENKNNDHNATAVTFIFDNAIKEIIQYEAEPVNDLTISSGSVALSLIDYIKSELPFKVVLPYHRKELVDKHGKLPFLIKYCDKFKPANVELKVASPEFKDEMSELLDGKNVDMITADNNLYTRVTCPENNDKNKATVFINRRDREAAYTNLSKKFDTLENF